MRTQISIYLLLLLSVQTLFAQDFSNKGKDFWIGYGNHVRMFNGNGTTNSNEKMQLYITSDVNTSGKVEIKSIGFSQSFTVIANRITTIDIPRAAALMDQGVYNHGIHVTSQNPVVVYSFIYVNAISGATVCLPTETLGKEYFSVNFAQAANENNAHSYFFVIAADTGTTTVEITPSADTKLGQPANVPFSVNLTQGQIYQVLGKNSGQSGVDLTGSKIRSISNTSSGCKKIAVFCGSGKIRIGNNCNNNTSDNLYQQMYPKATWGKKYIAVPGLGNINNYFRICKSDPAANVWLNGTLLSSASFVNNFYYELLTSTINVIESDKPILVAQYFTTQSCAGNPTPGDPDMIYLNPVEQTINNVTLNSMQPSSGTNIKDHYLNIVIKNNPEAIQSLKIDGNSYSSFTPVPNDPNFAYARLSVQSGTHNVTCDTGFNIISYGFGDAESYGYSGGTNLKDLYQFVSIKNQYATVDFPAGCRNSPFYFSMVLPYQPEQLNWNFNGIFPDTVIYSPAYDSTWMVNGKQLFKYKIDKPYVIHDLGSYPIKIVAQNPTPEGCSGEQEIDYTLQIFEKPKADMSLTYSGCLPDSLYFSDISVLDRPVIKRIWEFGDGGSSLVKNPVYKFQGTGNYTIKYNLITDIGCLSDTAFKVVEVNPSPIAMFGLKAPFCELRDISITDGSSIPAGNIAKWQWKMGNNDSASKTNPSAFVYQYNKAGNYSISLTVESEKGCRSVETTRTITVGANPETGFSMPGNCIIDPFSQFTDTSKIADGSEAAFSYLWNFGDANANNFNPNSATLKNPKHKYTATGNYTVTSIVTSNKGCVDTLSQQFTINGAKPLASISIKDSPGLCSNDTLVLTNLSTADIGQIVKLEVFWDYNNDPTKKLTDLNPITGKSYSFKYPEFFTPESTATSIRVIAYSGDNCLNSITQTIDLKSIPQLVFNPVPSVCADVAPFNIIQAQNVGTLTGIGRYTGKGISAAGLFYPKTAGVGIDTLKYTFTADNGCTNFIENTVQVYAVPVANAGPDLLVLEGDSIKLQGSGSGKGICYTWRPAYDLSNPDTIQPFAHPINSQYYTLTVRSSEGCFALDDVFIKVLKKPLMPNAFSPNGDGIHDVLNIQYLDSYPEATVEIYNRYGQIVYKTKGYCKPWDGTFNGNPVPIGTYYYLVNPKSGRKQMSGFVDLIR